MKPNSNPLHLFIILLLGSIYFSALASTPDKAKAEKKKTKDSLQSIVDLLKKNNQKKNFSISISLDGQEINDQNSEKKFIPASTVKVITSALALETLGEDYVFETDIEWFRHASGEAISQLKFYGGGDPTLGLKPFDKRPDSRIRAWAKTLSDQGVRSVYGQIQLISDNRIDHANYLDQELSDMDRLACYGAHANSFNFRGNCSVLIVTGKNRARWNNSEIKVPLYLKMKSGPQTRVLIDAIIDSTGSTLGYRIYGTWEAPCKTKPTDTDPGEKIEPPPINITNSRLVFDQKLRKLDENESSVFTSSKEKEHSSDITCRDKKSEKTKKVSVRLAVPNSKPWIVKTIARALSRYNIRWYPKKKIKVEANSFGWEHHTITSAPLKDVLIFQNKHSHNIISEAYFHAIGKHHWQQGDSSFRAAAQRATRAALKLWIYEASHEEISSQIRILDGSGLSRKNQASTKVLLQLLREFTRKPYFSTLLNSLPIAGVDGTLRYRLKSTRAENRVRAKTGTVYGSYQLAGYIQNLHYSENISEKYIPFVIFTETKGTNKKLALRIQDRLLLKAFDLINPI